MKSNLTFDTPNRDIVEALLAIGYKRSALQRDYTFSDFLDNGGPKSRTIHLAAFGREPFDYRSACFGIHAVDQNADPALTAKYLRALGAPQTFLIVGNETLRWVNYAEQSEYKETIPTRQLPLVIRKHKSTWNPEEVIRLKSGFPRPANTQLDFVDLGLLPALEHEAASKIDGLITGILYDVERLFKEQKDPFDAKTTFAVLFRLLTAKILKDRGIQTTPDIDFTNPDRTLEAVAAYFGPLVNGLKNRLRPEILKVAAKVIGESFPLQNISVDTLTYIYENTFVSSESRKALGIHSTPSYVADYLMSQVPFGALPRSKWNVLDPTCGHGILLIAAMRRMRDLLPKDWSAQQRHRFFVARLHGIEIDAFSVEVARMCLTLADFPETNGWNVLHQDVFASGFLSREASKATILVANPPFENMVGKGPETPKPAELLRQILPNLPQSSIIGLVLPRSFLDGSDYRKLREMLLAGCTIESITTLPDKVFLHSEAETAILVARKQVAAARHHTAYKEVKDFDRDKFKINLRSTWEDSVPQAYFSERGAGRLVVPLLRSVWARLEGLRSFRDIAQLKIGVQYEPSAMRVGRQHIIQTKPFRGSSPAIMKITDDFFQYSSPPTVHAGTSKEHQRRNAWQLDWTRPKVIVPASRISRGPWRHAAAIDTEGRIVSRNFYAVWPANSGITVEALAALLNSPVAVAFTYSHRTYEEIPVPHHFEDQVERLTELVREYLRLVATDHERARALLLTLDGIILGMYGLLPRMEREILDIFWGHARPVPVAFTGYFPPEYKSWIPLTMYLSETYQNATPASILARLPMTSDENVLKLMKNLSALV